MKRQRVPAGTTFALSVVTGCQLSRSETGKAMRVTSITAKNFGSADGRATRETADTRPKAESRALTVVAPAPAREDRPMAYRDASFLAHLIATKAQLPQTRAKRRIEPAEAMAAYRAVAALSR